MHGSFYSYRDIYLDLDPTYKDRLGRPLVRITMDFHENELTMNAYLTGKFAEIIKQMGAREVLRRPRKGPYDRHHRLSDDAPLRRRDHGHGPENERTMNRSCQSWDVPNLFVTEASNFPQNAGYNPTGTLAFWTSKAIRENYLKMVVCVKFCKIV